MHESHDHLGVGLLNYTLRSLVFFSKKISKVFVELLSRAGLLKTSPSG
jgi:hypothetical protein